MCEVVVQEEAGPDNLGQIMLASGLGQAGPFPCSEYCEGHVSPEGCGQPWLGMNSAVDCEDKECTDSGTASYLEAVNPDQSWTETVTKGGPGRDGLGGVQNPSRRTCAS